MCILAFLLASCTQYRFIITDIPDFPDKKPTYSASLASGKEYVLTDSPYDVIVTSSDGDESTVTMPAVSGGGYKSVEIPGYNGVSIDLYFADTEIANGDDWNAFSSAGSEDKYAVLTGDITVSTYATFNNPSSEIVSFNQNNTVTLENPNGFAQALNIDADNVVFDGFTIELAKSYSNPADPNPYIIKIGDMDNAVPEVIENIHLRNMVFNGNDIARYVNFHGTKNCSIEDSEINDLDTGTSGGYPGIQIASSENLIIDGIEFSNPYYISIAWSNSDAYWESSVTFDNLINTSAILITPITSGTEQSSVTMNDRNFTETTLSGYTIWIPKN